MYSFYTSLSESFMDMSKWAKSRADNIQGGGKING